MTDARASASETSPDPRRWRGLWVLLLGQFAALLDVSVTNVALPSIGRSTGSSPSELQWIVTGYVLAFGLMPIIGGRLGHIGGRRRIFIVGLVGFVARVGDFDADALLADAAEPLARLQPGDVVLDQPVRRRVCVRRGGAGLQQRQAADGLARSEWRPCTCLASSGR